MASEGAATISPTSNRVRMISAVRIAGTTSNETTNVTPTVLRLKSECLPHVFQTKCFGSFHFYLVQKDTRVFQHRLPNRGLNSSREDLDNTLFFVRVTQQK